MAGRNDKNTKHRFLVEALMLFAEKGYEAVSVAEIAKAVGCSAPALYKHYKSKQDLLEAIIEESESGFTKQMTVMKFDVENDAELRQSIIEMTEDEEIERAKEMVKYAIHNDFTQAFRKLCVVEQFHMERLAETYTYRYITYQFQQYEEIFKLWIESGKMKQGDAKAMATMYMAYPILAIGICDREPQKEDEVMEMLEKHIREFNRSFRIG